MDALGPEELERVLAEAVGRAGCGPCRVFGSYPRSVEHQVFIKGRMRHAS
ncbi:MAG: hypothetical protein IT437_04460 [Phycisphaerales bacterium]|nr:hypothetical protein [Phycisphaerales bacterium]